MEKDSSLLLAVAAVARTVRSLYGPNRLRKQVVDEAGQTLLSADAFVVASALQSQNAATAILQQALEDQQKSFGTGCSTLIALCGLLVEATLELQREGFPADTVQQALSSVERSCLDTAKRMRVSIDEILPSFSTLVWPQQLTALGSLLCTNPRATSLAVAMSSITDPMAFCDSDVPVQNVVTSQIVLGGSTTTSSSRVFGGVLLPIDEVYSASIRQRLPSEFVVDGGVAVVSGDVQTADMASLPAVQVVLVYGEVSTQVMDTSAACAPIFIPVASHDSLRQVVAMSGAEIIDAVEELLPSSVGREQLHLKLFDLSVRRSVDDDEEEPGTLFVQIELLERRYQPCASVLIRGPTASLSVELNTQVRRNICRLRSSLQSGYVLPGNGGFWCACAAAVAMEVEAAKKKINDPELLQAAAVRLADRLNYLGVILLENADVTSSNASGNSFFSRLANVRAVQQRFERGVRDVGADKFYSQYYDCRNTEYAVLSSKKSDDQPENEDGGEFHVDACGSKCAAIRGAFRVLQVLLSIDQYHIN